MEKIKFEPKVLREFEFEEHKFLLMEPTAGEMREAKARATKKYTDSINAQVRTKAQALRKLITEIPDFVAQHEKKRQDILNKIIELQSDLAKAVSARDRFEAARIAASLGIYRDTLLQEDQNMAEEIGITVEKLSDEERTVYLIFSMIKNTDKTPRWATYDEFLAEPSYAFVEVCRYYVNCWEWGLDPEWRDRLPESVALAGLEEIAQAEEAEKGAAASEETHKEKPEPEKKPKKYKKEK